jgi:hypothetical protein
LILHNGWCYVWFFSGLRRALGGPQNPVPFNRREICPETAWICAWLGCCLPPSRNRGPTCQDSNAVSASVPENGHSQTGTNGPT